MTDMKMVKRIKRNAAYFATLILLGTFITGCGRTDGISQTTGRTGNEVSGAGNGENAQDGGTDSKAADGGSVSEGGMASDDGGSVDSAMPAMSDMFTERDLSGDYDVDKCIKIHLEDGASTAQDSSVVIENNTVTICKEGVYLVDGSLSNGGLVVDADKTAKIQIVFAGVEISNDSFAPVYVKQADKVFLTLAEGAENRLANKGEFNKIDDNNVDSVIFSKEDLTLNGKGSLFISTEYGDGVVSKDDLVFTSGTYEIKASNHAISGKDSVRVAGGNFDLTAGKDGIHSENSDDDSLGFVYIENGEFNISAESDGIDAALNIDVVGGNVIITRCNEGMEGKVVNIWGGNIDITSSDDGLNATDGSGASQGGRGWMDKGGPWGDKDRNDNAASGGDDDIDGFSSATPPARPNESDGEIKGKGERPSMDGNRDFPGRKGETEGNDGMQDGMHGGMHGGMGKGGGMAFEEAQEGVEINIYGGEIRINAGGDGIDSNGDLNMSGGTVYVEGSENDGNGALDYSGTAKISGGTIVAVGMSGMAVNFGEDSEQGSMLVNFSANYNGGTISLKDKDKKELLTYTTEKRYNSVVISCPDIKQGESYTVSSAAGEKGSGESEVIEVKMDSLIYGGGQNGFFGGGRNKKSSEEGIL